jgi:RND family efflux transporter MFP subunit
MKKIKLMSVSVWLFLALLITGCGSDNDRPPPPKVIVSKPVLADVTDYLVETGNTVAYNSVDLVARVSGYLESVDFVDGSFVKKGKQLFVIQPQPYKDDVEEAQATLDADKAEYSYAVVEYQRQQKMYKQNATSDADVQQWLSQREEAKASVAGAKASLNSANITYNYTHVSAPFDGRIGRHLVDPNNLVGNGGEATKLATIEQIAPMYVYFNINELDLLKVRKIARANGFKPSQISQIPIEIGLQNEEGFPHVGHLDFADTGLDSSTGTIEMRGVLENKNYELLPGLFVRVRLALGQPKPHFTLPDTAVLYDQIGAYVFTIDKKNIVHQVRIKVGDVEKGMRTVLTGLKADDLVVVEGIQNATPDGEVAPTEKNIA